MKAYMALSCKVGAHNRVVKDLLDLSIPRRDIFLLFGSIDILLQFTGLKNIDEFKEKWFYPVRMIGTEEALITKTMTFIVVSEGPSLVEEPFAFIFLDTQPRDLEKVQKALLTIPEIMSADAVFGPYDVICSMKAKDRENLEQIISNIHEIPSIERSMTAIVASIKIYPEW